MLTYIFIIITLIVIGVIKQLNYYYHLDKDYNKVHKYRNLLITNMNEFPRKGYIDREDGVTLMKQSEDIQLILGHYGIVDMEIMGIRYSNYPLILNAIPEVIKMHKETSSLKLEEISEKVLMIDNGFLKYFNTVENIKLNGKSKVLNPINCLKVGIQTILSIPIILLEWVGLINSQKAHSASENKIVSLISGIISLLTVISLLMTILIGWDSFMEKVEEIISNIF